MRLFIFNSEIDVKILLRQEDKIFWKTNKSIYLIASKINNTVLNLTKILTKYKIDEIIYFGFGSSIVDNIIINDFVIVKNAYNTLVDLTKFNYKIGQFPNEKNNKNIENNEIKFWKEKVKNLKEANVGSSKLDIYNDYYLKYLSEKFENKIEVIDELSAPIFFTGKKFNVKNIYCFLIIEKSKYEKVIVENNLIINLFKNINAMLKKGK